MYCSLEQTIIELKKENGMLLDRNAWLEYGPDAFNFMLAENNTTGTDIICTCEGCLVNKRFTQLDLVGLNETFGHGDEERECVLKKCIRIQCERLGLVWQDCKEMDVGGSIDSEGTNDIIDTDIKEEDPTTLDCHIVFVNGFHSWDVDYGKKFTMTGLHENPDLDKLKELFSTLSDGDDEFFQDGTTNYYTLAEGRECL
jgi:hypothetical protein